MLAIAIDVARGEEDLSSKCAGAFRLTMKGYVPNGQDPALVCAPAPRTCSRPGGIFHLYVKMCAGLVVGTCFGTVEAEGQ